MQIVRISHIHHGHLLLTMVDQFIGRAEKEVKKILYEIYPGILIVEQFPLQKLIPHSLYITLNEEVQKHKFDLIVYTTTKLIVEVNYHHGTKATQKWRQIFTPMIEDLQAISVTVDDYECDSIFRHKVDSTKPLNKADYQDVIIALQLAGISVKFTIPEYI